MLFGISFPCNWKTQLNGTSYDCGKSASASESNGFETQWKRILAGSVTSLLPTAHHSCDHDENGQVTGVRRVDVDNKNASVYVPVHGADRRVWLHWHEEVFHQSIQTTHKPLHVCWHVRRPLIQPVNTDTSDRWRSIAVASLYVSTKLVYVEPTIPSPCVTSQLGQLSLASPQGH